MAIHLPFEILRSTLDAIFFVGSVKSGLREVFLVPLVSILRSSETKELCNFVEIAKLASRYFR